jgi:hypothetical protein
MCAEDGQTVHTHTHTGCHHAAACWHARRCLRETQPRCCCHRCLAWPAHTQEHKYILRAAGHLRRQQRHLPGNQPHRPGLPVRRPRHPVLRAQRHHPATQHRVQVCAPLSTACAPRALCHARGLTYTACARPAQPWFHCLSSLFPRAPRIAAAPTPAQDSPRPALVTAPTAPPSPAAPGEHGVLHAHALAEQ